jgi:prepilin-type N-terminal cleavage/methylation domain-containing protein
MRSFKKLKSNLDSGFTLIELLVVIIIIGILAGIAVIGVSGAQNAAVKKACVANATQITKGIRAYYASNGTFPTMTSSVSSATTQLATAPSKFLETIPAELDTFTGQKYKLTIDTTFAGGVVTVTSDLTGCGPITG